MESETYLGKVKWFNPHRGYGFITRVSDEKDFFIYHKDIISDKSFKILHENDYVHFKVTHGDRGYKAVDVKVKEPPLELVNKVFGNTNSQEEKDGTNN